MAEEERTDIEEYMGRFGFEVKEARVAHHLDSALVLLLELYDDDGDPEGDEDEFDDESAARVEAIIMSHYTALWDRLARRVLARDYPRSWWGDTPRHHEEDEE